MSRLPFISRAFLVVLSVLLGDLAFGAGKEREGERVVLRLSLREGGSLPSIAGDFTKWAPVRMMRYENEWRFSVTLPPGVYHFAFRGKDGKWFVPRSFPNRINDGMGGWVAVLVVQ
jgi:hypothetical protein